MPGMDGLVDIESKLGVGTTFRVYLPLAETDAAAGDAAHRAPAKPPTGTELVPLAEDEPAPHTRLLEKPFTTEQLARLVRETLDA